MATPSRRVVSPGAKVTYRLEPTSKSSRSLERVFCLWFCVNDPESVTFFRPRQVSGPMGSVEWADAEWEFEGRHRIVCRTVRGEEKVDFTYDQEVAPLDAVLAMGPTLPQAAQDPEAALDGATRFTALVAQIAKQFPPAPGAVRERHEQQLAGLEEYRDKLRERLASTAGARRYPVLASHFAIEGQQRQSLNVFVAKVGSEWVLVDWTNPAVRGLTGEYRGSGDTAAEAIRDALSEWDSDNRYPDGMIEYEIRGVPQVPALEGRFETDGSSFWDSVSSFFTWVGIGAAATAAAIMFLSPVPGPQAVSVLIWTSIFSSTAAATINISQRAAEGFSSWKANAFDVLSIVGNMFGAAGVLWTRGAQLTLQTSRGVLKTVLIGQVATDGVQGVLIAADHVAAFEDIRKDPKLTPREKAQRLLELARSLSVNGLLIYINVKGTKADLDNLNLRPQHVEGQSPAERLRQLADPNASIDMTKPPSVEGHTAKGEHTTTVQVDARAQTPQVGGRGHTAATTKPPKQPPPKGPQKTANLDVLYADAAVAQKELSQLTTNIARELGGEPLIPPTLKGRPRAEEKIKADYAGDASQLVDLARSSIVFKSVEQVQQAIASVKSRAKVVRVKDRFEQPANGYRDVLFNLEMPNGHVVEMQLHLEGVLRIKEGEGHAIYEQVRSITAKAKIEKRAQTAAELAEIEALNARMKKLYDDAFEQAKGGP